MLPWAQRRQPSEGVKAGEGTDLIDLMWDMRACFLEPGDGAVAEPADHCHQGVEVLELVELL